MHYVPMIVMREKPPSHIGFLRPCLVLAIFLFMLAGAWAAELPLRSYTIGVTVRDSSGKLVPDALVMIRAFNQSGTVANADLLNYSRLYEAYTNPSGYATLRIIAGFNQSTPLAVMSVYTPYWSSGAITLTLPDRSSVQEQTITLPLPLNTYTVRVWDVNQNPVPQASVYLQQPFVLGKATDINGLVVFRLPANVNVSGYVRYMNKEQKFAFEHVNQSDTPWETALRVPLRDAARPAINRTYDLTLLLYDSMGRPLDRAAVVISTNESNWTFVTDRNGYLYMRGWPSQKINLSWTSFNYTYNFEVNISRPPISLRMPMLINISNPISEALGDSCYRISLNVSDKRQHPSLRVVARAANGAGVIPFSMDKIVKLENNSGLQFSRVLCVESDMAFDVLADNPFEQASLQIQLKSMDEAPVKSIYTQLPPPGLLNKDKKSDDSRKVELVLVLFYVFLLLMVLFISLRFKGSLMFILQSISRFTYLSYQDRQASRPPKGVKGGK